MPIQLAAASSAKPTARMIAGNIWMRWAVSFVIGPFRLKCLSGSGALMMLGCGELFSCVHFVMLGTNVVRVVADQDFRLSPRSPKKKAPHAISMQGFIIWLLDLGSNQGPTD